MPSVANSLVILSAARFSGLLVFLHAFCRQFPRDFISRSFFRITSMHRFNLFDHSPPLIRTLVVVILPNLGSLKTSVENARRCQSEPWTNFNDVLCVVLNLVIPEPDFSVNDRKVENVVDEGLTLWVVPWCVESLHQTKFHQL